MGDGLFIELNIALMPAQPLADELASTSQAIAKKTPHSPAAATLRNYRLLGIMLRKQYIT